MPIWFHTTILTTSLVATIAVGIASAGIHGDVQSGAAPKADRLPVARRADVASVTVETRGHGISILEPGPHGQHQLIRPNRCR